jgi:septal ring factor EnvC (AmiA/AmiB activator)
LTELRDLRALQLAAGEVLGRGLGAAQAARSALSQAMSDRTELPRRFTEDPEVLKGLLESADTLEAFASGLALDQTGTTAFGAAKGKLDLPVLGRMILKPGETDARGVTRPGLTIRYTGPLLDYGNVMILEPGDGYLMVLAGMEQVYGAVGEVIARGAPLGLMGGAEPGVADFLATAADGGGIRGTETLYLELRQGADPVDPLEWFAATAASGE